MYINREQLQEAQWEAAKANLVQCANCGRRFATDRIGVHERICKGLKHGPPPGVGAGKNQQQDDYGEQENSNNSGPQMKNATTSRVRGHFNDCIAVGKLSAKSNGCSKMCFTEGFNLSKPSLRFCCLSA